MQQSEQWRERMYRECEKASQRELTEEQARSYRQLSEQIGYPWYPGLVKIKSN